MKLQYRGIPYKYEPIAVRLGGYFGEGKYRGVPAKYAIFTADVPSPEFELTYRGVAYHVGQPKDIASPNQGAVRVPETATDSETPAAEETLTMNEQLRRLMMAHHRQIRKREQSMLARSDVKAGLSVEDATHFQNHIQGYIPYNEWMDCDRSHVAMS